MGMQNSNRLALLLIGAFVMAPAAIASARPVDAVAEKGGTPSPLEPAGSDCPVKEGSHSSGDVTVTFLNNGNATTNNASVNVTPCNDAVDNTDSVVTVNDKTGTSESELEITGLEKGDTVNLNGNGSMEITISGSGGSVFVNNEKASGSVSAVVGGLPIELTRADGSTVSVLPGQTAGF